MSNCVEFDTPAVHFKPSELDMKRLRNLLESVPQDWTMQTLPQWQNDEPAELSNQRMAWWYLQRCVDWHADGVVIRFGQGRSTHTYRDFKGIVRVLQPMMLRPKSKVLTIRDESDGFRSRGRIRVDFLRGEVTDA